MCEFCRTLKLKGWGSMCTVRPIPITSNDKACQHSCMHEGSSPSLSLSTEAKQESIGYNRQRMGLASLISTRQAAMTMFGWRMLLQSLLSKKGSTN